jgi:hypothetical protein
LGCIGGITDASLLRGELSRFGASEERAGAMMDVRLNRRQLSSGWLSTLVLSLSSIGVDIIARVDKGECDEDLGDCSWSRLNKMERAADDILASGSH